MLMENQTLCLVENIRSEILQGKLGPDPKTIPITGSCGIYQTTQFPSTSIKYENYYLLLRVEEYFGASSYAAGQLSIEAAAHFSGQYLDAVLRDSNLAVQIAAMDAYCGHVFPHGQHCKSAIHITAGTPIQKASMRDAAIAELANIRRGQNIALIGVVNPLVKAIKERGGICLPCDLQLKQTEDGQLVETDMELVLEQADNVICTAMTLSNGTFDRILQYVRSRNIPLTVYAQTGSALAAQFVKKGVTTLVAEPFPFTQFSSQQSTLYHYTAQ